MRVRLRPTFNARAPVAYFQCACACVLRSMRVRLWLTSNARAPVVWLQVLTRVRWGAIGDDEGTYPLLYAWLGAPVAPGFHYTMCVGTLWLDSYWPSSRRDVFIYNYIHVVADAGNISEKTWADEAAAQKFADKKVAEKLKKGCVVATAAHRRAPL